MAEGSQGLMVRLEYNTDIFDPSTVDRLVDHFQILLQGIVGDPQQHILDLPLLGRSECDQLLVEWNATEADYPRGQCLHQRFETQVERTPDAIALSFENQSLTYQKLNEQANRLAHYLQKRGIGPATLVGVYVQRSLAMMVALLAVQKSGAAYVPIDPAYPADRIGSMLEDAQAPLVLTEKSLLDSLPPHAGEALCLDEDAACWAQESAANPGSNVAPEDLLYVIFTSGSTGRPKGVQVRHRAVVNLLTCMAREMSMGESDVVPALASFAFDMCIPELYLALVTGGRVVIGHRDLAANGEELAALLRQTGATLVHATPTTWRLLLEAGFTGKGLKRVIGAEPLSAELCTRLLEADPSLYNFYGPTETTVWSTFHQFRSKDEPLTVGRPLANTQVYILDKNLHPVPIGVPGEIHIGGDGVACGYLKRPELTAEKFIADPFSTKPGAKLYKTGDLGCFFADGRIEFRGRGDNQVKLRGYRIELGEIETILAQHPAVQQAVVVARENTAGDKRLVAYVIPVAGEDASASQLRAHVKDELPEYMVPSAFVTLEKFPLTPNGKVDRKNLPAPDYAPLELGREYVEARTAVEEVIAGIWAKVLKLDRVGMTDHFFELGGHSLLATQVVSRIRLALQVELPLRALFEAPTVSGLAQRVELLQRQEQGLDAPPLKPAGRDQALPLSFAQQRLWFLDQLEPDNPLYNVPHIVRVTGALNAAVLEKSLNEIVRRHEALRTSFQTVNGEPVQVMAPRLTLPLAFTDLGSIAEAERESEARKLAAEEIKRPFNLRTGPLLRASLLKLADQDHVLVLTTHHIVSDRWSLGVLSQELSALYEAFVEGRPSPLPELPIQYADYAVWQRQFLSGEVLEKQLAYWKQQLRGAPPVLEIPTDRPRPPQESFRGDIKVIPISAVVTDKLKALSRGEGVTLFMTLLAAWQVLLSRYSGQEDIVVGIPIANRNRSEIEGLIGFFANTLALRGDLSGNPTFRELLTRVREVALSAYAHQDLPFEKLVEELRPERSLSHNPLFQVLFALQNTPALDQEIPGLKLQAMGAKVGTAKCDLALFMAEGSQGLMVRLEYNTDIFDPSTIDRLVDHFQILLQGIVGDPQQHIFDLPLLGRSERDQILAEFNATSVEYPQNVCVHEFFEKQVAQTPNAIAAISDQQRLSYRELNSRANQLAHFLQKRGIGPESLIGICMERSLEMLIGILGILKAGGAYVPLDPAYPKERLASSLEDAKASLLITQQSLLESLPAETETICLDRDWPTIARESEMNPVRQVKPENLAYVLFTSGSTGRPKGVALEHRSAATFIHWAQSVFTPQELEGVLFSTSICFDLSVFEMFVPLSVGGKLILAQNALYLSTLAAKNEVTLINTVPSAIAELVRMNGVPASVKTVNLAGEALPDTLVEQIYASTSVEKVYNLYGPTEATTYSTFTLVPRGAAVTIGVPIANTQAYILDGHLNPVPVGVSGELHLAGAGLARGYFGRPELTAERFVANPFSSQNGCVMYRTGDLCRWLPDGNIQYLGRMDNQIKLRGFRIELGEIEVMLGRHPDVRHCVVMAREDEPGNKRLVAYIVPQQGREADEDELRAFLKQKLPDYMLPGAFVSLLEFPLTPNRKVDRRLLPIPNASRASNPSAVLPRNSHEAMLVKIWQELLGIESVGVKDNFFELGGHSFLAVRLVSEIQKATGKVVPLAALFKTATIEALANLISADSNSPEQIVMAIQPQGSQLPFFAIVTPGMNALGYVTLARHLGNDQPLYRIQGPGPRLKGRPYSSVEFENLANDYIKAMQTIQPRGPYYFGGMCEGARIAFDMARILEGRGEEVALLVILDTWVIENSQIRFLWKIDYYSGRFKDFWQMSVPEKRKTILKWLRDRVDRRVSGSNGSRSQWPAAYWPGPFFVPPKFGGKITLLKTPKQPYYYVDDPYMGWGARTMDKVELQLIEVNARKHILLLREPYVRQVAVKLSDSLRRARSRDSEQSIAMAVHQ
jgi:amino acid adenylation domain-containing protein